MMGLRKKLGLGCLLIKIFLLSLEGLIFHQMENLFCCRLGSGKLKTKTVIWNIVHFFIEKIS